MCLFCWHGNMPASSYYLLSLLTSCILNSHVPVHGYSLCLSLFLQHICHSLSAITPLPSVNYRLRSHVVAVGYTLPRLHGYVHGCRFGYGLHTLPTHTPTPDPVSSSVARCRTQLPAVPVPGRHAIPFTGWLPDDTRYGCLRFTGLVTRGYGLPHTHSVTLHVLPRV